eukprot:gnl/MRDRNA2_/MRDRNA2_363723_c0_seq1.p1 gnl/MRDRNA2_/MRDRNA2_363723_c0~~gnl/MRDRNA2_/MRDRNA2_363723_c0_seq1.p1  ORF type:complete len:170 (+),score=32.90 gnl/MRDRNA2_/MRDRNA2_363723_c0_seq1:39-512(+)
MPQLNCEEALAPEGATVAAVQIAILCKGGNHPEYRTSVSVMPFPLSHSSALRTSKGVSAAQANSFLRRLSVLCREGTVCTLRPVPLDVDRRQVKELLDAFNADLPVAAFVGWAKTTEQCEHVHEESFGCGSSPQDDLNMNSQSFLEGLSEDERLFFT